MNYYAILDIKEYASTNEIKKAFRKKLKAHHPDVHVGNKRANDEPLSSTSTNEESERSADFYGPNNSTESNKPDKLLDIINAYNVLSNPVKRRHYDMKTHTMYKDVNSMYTSSEEFAFRRLRKVFNYEHFLLKRQHEWQYVVKLFVYDLVYCNGDRAVKIYERIVLLDNKDLLKKELGNFDYYDCMFLLAEYYQNSKNQKNINKVIRLFLEIGIMENKKPYFKSYMEEVADRVFLLIDAYDKYFFDIDVLHSLLNNMKSWTILQKQKHRIEKLLVS